MAKRSADVVKELEINEEAMDGCKFSKTCSIQEHNIHNITVIISISGKEFPHCVRCEGSCS